MLIPCGGALQVEWNNPADPNKGFKYLYLTDKDYQAIWKGADHPWIKAKPVMVQGAQSNSLSCCAAWRAQHISTGQSQRFPSSAWYCLPRTMISRQFFSSMAGWSVHAVQYKLTQQLN